MSLLLKSSPRYDHVPSPRPHARKVFDRDSGQVYTEVVARGGPMTADWVWKTIGSTREAATFRSLGPGCASLENMAIRCALKNMLSITAGSLETLPWELGKRLWRRISACKLDSVYTWKVFAAAYPREDKVSLKRRHHVILKPNMALAAYVAPITSPSFNWLTFLTLSHVTCSRADLVNISKLVNIGALTIGRAVSIGETGLDDSIVRAWSRAATEADAFSTLRVFACRSQKEITPRSFAYFNQFPALALFVVEDCNFGPQDKEQARCLGWKYKTGKDLSDFFMGGGLRDHKWNSILHASFRCGGVYGTECLTAEGVEAIDSLPVLHLSLGRNPPDAALDLQKDERTRCFERMSYQVAIPTVQNRTAKRPASEAVQMSGQPRKKPTIRSSKQQSFDDLLSGFGS